MSEFEHDHEEEAESPDPGKVAFLDQETEAFNNDAEAFEETFGFQHRCHCAQDYTDGRMIEVPQCFAELCEDAMAACRELKEERDYLAALIQDALNGG